MYSGQGLTNDNLEMNLQIQIPEKFVLGTRNGEMRDRVDGD